MTLEKLLRKVDPIYVVSRARDSRKAEILKMRISARARVAGKLPGDLVRIFVDKDLIGAQKRETRSLFTASSASGLS